MICQVCYLNEAKGVFASQLGPCSNSLCEKCLENKAEIKGFCELLEEKDCYNSDIYRNNLLKCTVFHHGDYLSWDEYKKKLFPESFVGEVPVL